jgi:RNA polymerase sigma-70 factor (ECF subfamily)
VTKREDQPAVVESARKGDPSALAQLYREFGDTVYAMAYRLMASRADAEDVLQDVFLGLPEGLRTYREQGSLEGWIKKVAARTALMKLRSRRSKAEVSLDFVAAVRAARPESSPGDRVALEVALSQLPSAQRAVFVLKEVDGYGHAEIGAMLGITATASKVRLHRARRKLRELLEGP